MVLYGKLDAGVHRAAVAKGLVMPFEWGSQIRRTPHGGVVVRMVGTLWRHKIAFLSKSADRVSDGGVAG